MKIDGLIRRLFGRRRQSARLAAAILACSAAAGAWAVQARYDNPRPDELARPRAQALAQQRAARRDALLAEATKARGANLDPSQTGPRALADADRTPTAIRNVQNAGIPVVTLTVDDDRAQYPAADYTSVQDALNRGWLEYQIAYPNPILVDIIIYPGTYHESIIFQGNETILRSTDPTNPSVVAATVIDAGGGSPDPLDSRPVVTMAGVETSTSVISGLTLTGGLAHNGGGIYGVGSMVTIEYNVITGNVVKWQDGSTDRGRGGGIYECDGLIEHNTITNNVAELYGGGLATCQGTIQNNTISNNDAYNGGGGLYWCLGLVQNNTITNNIASLGGGLRDCDGIVQFNMIANNTATRDATHTWVYVYHDPGGAGGGLDSCWGIIQNNVITGNNALYGGGLYWCPQITSNSITKNTAQFDGGAIFGRLGEDFGNGQGLIAYNTISENIAAGLGGAVSICDGYDIVANTCERNSAANGGAFSGGGWPRDNKPRCNVDQGDMSAPYDLTGLHMDVHIAANIIRGNSASQNGGAFYEICSTRHINKPRHGDGSDYYEINSYMENNFIESNTAGQNGGAFYRCGGTEWDKPSDVWHVLSAYMRRNLIVGNQALNGGPFYDCDLCDIWDNIIWKNQAGNLGGALMECGEPHPKALHDKRANKPFNEPYIWEITTVWNNTIWRNSQVGTGGAGIRNGGVYLLSTLVWDNRDGGSQLGTQYQSSGNVGFSCIQGWSGGGVNNIAIAPKITDAAGGNFYPKSDSPLIDNGGIFISLFYFPDTDWTWVPRWMTDFTPDIVGTGRPIDADVPVSTGDGTKMDIGAFEFVPAPHTISGRVTSPVGTGILGVTVSADNGGGMAVTDANGFYGLLVPYHWTGGTVTPSLFGYTFVPPLRFYTKTIVDQENQDFLGVTPPPNDNFANAQVIAGRFGHLRAWNIMATKETGEPAHAGGSGQASVWYTWTAPATAQATFDTTGSQFDTVLAVYTGASLSSLSEVAGQVESDYNNTLFSRATFDAVADQTYMIAVDGQATSDTGVFALNWQVQAPPPNDNFADASPILAETSQVTGANVLGTKELGEPNHAGNPGGASIWWSWTAPQTGFVTLDTLGSDFDTLLAVYRGSAVSNLTEMASNDDAQLGVKTSAVSLSAIRNSVYTIAVDGKNGATGSVVLNLRFTAVQDSLFNISTRGFVGTGNDAMIAGFIIEGPDPKQVLVSGLGPSLTDLGVPDVLANPILSVYSGSRLVGLNDNWINSVNKGAIQATNHAPSSNLESAVIITLDPGAYTGVLSGVIGGTGNGLIVVWDVGGGRSLLTNISTRGLVGAGDNVMIAGFIVEGLNAKHVAVTGWGPSLAPLGVPNALSDPTLTVYSGQTAKATNDNWGDLSQQDIDTLTAASLIPSDSWESAAVLTLDPGEYTAILSGVGGVTGNGLIAVWDLDAKR